MSYLKGKFLKGFVEAFLTGMILIDLEKAFDTIDLEMLLQKMKAIRFSKETLQWFGSYLSEQVFLANIESKLTDFEKNSYGVSQGFISGPIWFLIYVKNMPKAVKSTLLYADDSSILYQHKEVDEIEKHLNKDFEHFCGWHVDNKLNIHFSENKTKLILFASKRRSKCVRQLNIRYNHINIKQHSQVTYLRCVLDERMSSEPMALKIINKVNGKLKLKLTEKIDIPQNSFAECSAMFLFSHTLIMRVPPGTLISMKNRKRKHK